ncbi:shikimate kinase AroK [Granulosicoccaceae sp. 1_MG-2023]|nr:shikimate kinase AroK [Granulosicoccaceae sp. 1_MG-2023]
MNPKENIFLIGPMGAGKTTVGRALAKRLKREFFDSDKEIERQCGVNIPTIFDIEGEEGFRLREAKMIDELSARDGIVLATGGGAPMREENRKKLAERGIVIYLSVTLQEQFNRISHDKNRPLLKTDDPRGTLRRLMKERAPVYETLASIKINSTGRNMRYVIERILRFLRQREQKKNHPTSSGKRSRHDNPQH